MEKVNSKQSFNFSKDLKEKPQENASFTVNESKEINEPNDSKLKQTLQDKQTSKP